MLEDFSIRPASFDDLQKLIEIEKGIHVAPWSREHFESELSKPFSRVWLLTDDDTDEKIAAYLCFWMMDDYAQILNIGVDFPYRGQGHAQRLIQSLIRDSIRDQMSRITLEVRVSNENAIGLYRKAGFVQVSVRKRFYSNGEDAIVMDLILNVAKISGSG